MTLPREGRDGTEIEALVTDRYLDALLAGGSAGPAGRGVAGPPDVVDPLVRVVADRLARSLPRFHPSFRFEEALSARLTAAALARRLPAAAGAEGTVVAWPGGPTTARDLDDLAALDLDDPELAAYLAGETPGVTRGGDTRAAADPRDPREALPPILVRGALTSAALSIAGAAFVAWRRRRPDSPMARAVRAVARSRPD